MKRGLLLSLFFIYIVLNLAARTANPEPYAYPNPFQADGKKTVEIFIPRQYGTTFRLEVYAVSGKLIRVINSERMKKGLLWDGRDDEGRLVVSGIYFVYIRPSGRKHLPVPVFPLSLYH